MKSSTQDKVEGKIRAVTGAVKEQTGKAVRDYDLQDKGTAEKLAGKAQSKMGDIKKVFNK